MVLGASRLSTKKKIDFNKLDRNIKVGWRGPAILLSDAKKYMPAKVTHYGTWWDDYATFKYNDYT